MNKKVKMKVARDKIGETSCYVVSSKPLFDGGKHGDTDWSARSIKDQTIICPDEFEQAFNFHLDPGQGPVEITFPKIEVEVVKE